LLAACSDGGGATDGPIFIDAEDDAFVCNESCNVLTQTGCCADYKCSWVRVSTGDDDSQQLGQLACVPDGTVAVGEACSYGPSGASTGFDNCASGGICLASPAVEQASGSCSAICSLADAILPCATGFACGAYSKFFSNNPMDTPVAGVCDPTCDVLTQIRSDGAEACGSSNPLMPNRGCYGFPSSNAAPTDFSCTGAGALGHRAIVTPPIYTNSCLPGAIPMLRESAASMARVCIAPCAPLTINNQQNPEALDGAEPHSCPQMPLAVGVMNPQRATGAGERCQFNWWWEDEETPIGPASNGVGWCVDFTKYEWDHDGNMGTPPVAWTLPETLTPYADIMNVQPTEDFFWGTAPYPTMLIGTKPARVHTARDLGFRPLESQRSLR
jgi:hypothetical protein